MCFVYISHTMLTAIRCANPAKYVTTRVACTACTLGKSNSCDNKRPQPQIYVVLNLCVHVPITCCSPFCACRSPICRLIAAEELWTLLDALQEPVPAEVHQHLENISSSTTPLLVCHQHYYPYCQGTCLCMCIVPVGMSVHVKITCKLDVNMG